MVRVKKSKKLKKTQRCALLVSLCCTVGIASVVVFPASVGIQSYEDSLINQLALVAIGSSAGQFLGSSESLVAESIAIKASASAEQFNDESLIMNIDESEVNDEALIVNIDENEITDNSEVDRETKNSTLFCATRECAAYYQEAEPLARAFPDHRSWCTDSSKEEDSWQGMLLIKVPKAASSTSAGVALRIADRHKCAVQWQHRLAEDYRNHSTEKAFLLTTIRDPASRAISSIFFHIVSQQNKKATDELVLQQLKQSNDFHYGSLSGGRGGFTLRYTSLDPIPEGSAWSPAAGVLRPDLIQANVKNIIHEYDFLLVVERMEESLVAMAMVMGIDLGDVLTTASKVAGSTYHLARNPKRCVATEKSFVSPAVKSHLDSEQWHEQNYGDYLLHAAASLSLNKTIERLGVGRFQTKLKEFQELRALERKLCAPLVQFPCSNKGEPQPKVAKKSCYKGFYDFGCGHLCHDEMISNLTKAKGR